MEQRKALLSEEGRIFFTGNADLHIQYGMVKKADIEAAKPGDVLETNTGTKLTVIEPGFLDQYGKIKRGPQIIPLKDVALMVAETGIGKTSKVLDAGSGSGALATFLGHLAKQVYSYEIREDFFKISQGNVEKLGLTNVTVKLRDVYEGIEEKNLDVIFIDLPEPWKVIGHAQNALKPGGYFVNYSPTVPQVADFVNSLTERFIHLKTIEILEREWDVKGRKVRPKSQQIGHSGVSYLLQKDIKNSACFFGPMGYVGKTLETAFRAVDTMMREDRREKALRRHVISASLQGFDGKNPLMGGLIASDIVQNQGYALREFFFKEWEPKYFLERCEGIAAGHISASPEEELKLSFVAGYLEIPLRVHNALTYSFTGEGERDRKEPLICISVEEGLYSQLPRTLKSEAGFSSVFEENARVAGVARIRSVRHMSEIAGSLEQLIPHL